MRKLRVYGVGGLRSGNSSDSNSACLKVLVPVEMFQFSDMHYETERYRDSTDGLKTMIDKNVTMIDKNVTGTCIDVSHHSYHIDL